MLLLLELLLLELLLLLHVVYRVLIRGREAPPDKYVINFDFAKPYPFNYVQLMVFSYLPATL